MFNSITVHNMIEIMRRQNIAKRPKNRINIGLIGRCYKAKLHPAIFGHARQCNHAWARRRAICNDFSASNFHFARMDHINFRLGQIKTSCGRQHG